MKRLMSLMLAIVAASASAIIIAGTPINQSELPKAARSFITKHFASEQVKKVEKDNGRRGMEYEVDFTSGAELEFTSDGEWKEVKAARGQAVPAAIIPSGIAKYVSTNFSGLSIVEIARKRGGYEVVLSNGSELKLTADGAPMQPRQGGRGRRN